MYLTHKQKGSLLSFKMMNVKLSLGGFCLFFCCLLF